MAYSPSQNYLAAGGRSKFINIWSTLDWQLLKIENGHKTSINALAFSSSGKILASASDIVRFWDTTNGKLLKRFSKHKNEVNCLAFSHDDQLVATASYDDTAYIWRFDSLTKLIKISYTPNSSLVFEFSPVGNTIAVGGEDGSLVLWEERKVSEVVEVEGWLLKRILSGNGTSLCLRNANFNNAAGLSKDN